MLSISYGSVFSILHEDLGFCKQCQRWVSRILPDDHMGQHFQCSLIFLQQYSAEGNSFCDESSRGMKRGSTTSPPKQRTSMESVHTSSQRKKAKVLGLI
ncbi:hypothetical protein TNCV_4232261 [Trichonephila clavipes]|nr:hypothetical protein TNCV_4232261 [Trichonephila clavipes]